MPQAATMKKPLSSVIYNRMRSEAEKQVIKTEAKTFYYRGYKIIVYTELVEGAGSICIIKNAEGCVAERRGIDLATKYIDRLINPEPPKFKVKRERPKTEVTPDCSTHKVMIKIKRKKEEKKWR